MNKINIHSTRIFLVLLFSLGCFFKASGQLIELPNVELITEKEGLPFNSLADILEDNRGFLWVSGPNGLARYDGYTFLPVPASKSAGFIITTLAKDLNGTIWIGGINGLVKQINPETLETKQYQLFEKPTTSLATKLFGDSSGNVWCFAEGIGLFKFNGTGFTFIGALHNLPTKGLAVPNFYNRLASFYEESPSVLWLATSNGLYKFHTDKLKIEHVSSLSDDSNRPAFLHFLVSDGRGGFWCSTYGTGLIHFNPQTKAFKSYLFEKGFPGTANIIYGISRKSDHELWISCRGLGVFDERAKTFSFYYDVKDINNGLASYSMVHTKSGIVWMVTDRGLMKWAPDHNKFDFFKIKVTKSDNQSYYSVSGFLYDSANNRRIVATSFADGIHIFDSLNRETIVPFYTHQEGEPYLIVRDVIKDRDGKIIVVTRDQLYEISIDNKLVKINGPNQLLSPQTVPFFFKIMQASNGDYWLASSRNGLFHYNRKRNEWRLFTEQTTNTLASNRVFGLEEDDNQKIWAAHPLHGLSIYSLTSDTWEYVKYRDGDSTGLVSNVFTDLTRTKNGKMIFTTIEGISMIDVNDLSIQNFTESTGLPNHYIYSALTDSDDNIWVVNNSGLMALNTKGKVIREFNSNDGLRGIYGSFNLLPSGNKMLISTYQGFYVFNPKEALQKMDASVPLYVTGISNQNSDLAGFSAPKSVAISYSSNALSIEFAALNFPATQKNRYRYTMEGLDKAWTETFSNNVNYSGLPSGSYVFKVQLADGSNAEAAIEVVVSTPFWKQGWFRLLIMSFIVGLSFLAYRARLRAVRQEEKLKADFHKQLAEVEMKALKAQMSPHFIFNSLNSINRYIVKSEPEKASLYLTKFSKLIRLILDNSNSKIISLDQELNALKLYIELEALRFNDKFTYSIIVNKELNPISIGVPPMIIQPFIENAIWHGLLHKEASGHLNISIDRFGHGLQCIIEDNGVGRKKAAELKSKSVNKEKSYGMKITSERLNMLNGESKVSNVEIIDLQDAAGNPLGTKVIIKIMSAELEPEF